MYACLLNWPTNTIEITLGAPIPTSDTVVTLFGSDMGPLKWRSLNGKGGMIIDLSEVNAFRLMGRWSWVFKLEHILANQSESIVV